MGCNNMHIVCVISSLMRGGAERVLSELTNHLIAKAARVTIILFTAEDHIPSYYLDPRIDLVYLNNNSKSDTNCVTKYLRLANKIYSLRETIKNLQPDKILSFMYDVNIVTIIATLGINIPVLISERVHPAFHPVPKLYMLLRKLTYRFVTKIIVQTTSIAEYFSGSITAKIVIIPNVVRIPEATIKNARLAEPVLNIVAVGRLVAQKGFDYLITAVAELMQTNSKIRLIIYGVGVDRDVLLTAVKSYGLEDRIQLVGVVHDIYAVLQQADIFISTSRYEGMPNALCEAMSVGLPVIAANCPGNIDVVTDNSNGLLFAVGNVAELQDALTLLIKDASLRVKLGTNASKIVATFADARIYCLWDAVLL